jgi:hypothetical protein
LFWVSFPWLLLEILSNSQYHRIGERKKNPWFWVHL